MKANILVKESTRYPGLFVHKYSRNVFLNNLWNTDPKLLESRGHVYNSDDKLVVAPFTKVFNYGENGTVIADDEVVVAVDKINGFMATATYVPGYGVVVGTTGSLDSDFVAMAEKYITEDIKRIISAKYENFTFIFEIVHPDDPHIIEEQEGAYLIGMRYLPAADVQYTTYVEKERVLDELAEEFGVLRPKWGVKTMRELLEQVKSYDREGFLAYGKTQTLKLKSPYYLSAKAIARKKDLESLDKSRVAEEFYMLLDHMKINSWKYSKMNEQERLAFIREWFYG